MSKRLILSGLLLSSLFATGCCYRGWCNRPYFLPRPFINAHHGGGGDCCGGGTSMYSPPPVEFGQPPLAPGAPGAPIMPRATDLSRR